MYICYSTCIHGSINHVLEEEYVYLHMLHYIDPWIYQPCSGRRECVCTYVTVHISMDLSNMLWKKSVYIYMYYNTHFHGSIHHALEESERIRVNVLSN